MLLYNYLAVTRREDKSDAASAFKFQLIFTVYLNYIQIHFNLLLYAFAINFM